MIIDTQSLIILILIAFIVGFVLGVMIARPKIPPLKHLLESPHRGIYPVIFPYTNITVRIVNSCAVIPQANLGRTINPLCDKIQLILTHPTL